LLGITSMLTNDTHNMDMLQKWQVRERATTRSIPLILV
jgi:hypothetical protein